MPMSTWPVTALPVIKPSDPRALGIRSKVGIRPCRKPLAQQDNITAHRAMECGDRKYTIVLWRENANDSGYSYTATLENNQAKANL